MIAFRSRFPHKDLFVAVFLALIDLFIIATVLHPYFSWRSSEVYPSSSLLGAVVFPIGYVVAGLYPGYGLPAAERFRRKTIATLFIFGSLIFWDWLFLRKTMPADMLAVVLGLALVLPTLIESIVREILVKFGFWGTPVLILGTGSRAALIARILRKEQVLGLNPIGFLSFSSDNRGTSVEGLPVLGTIADAKMWAQKGVKVAVAAMADREKDEWIEFWDNSPFIKVIFVPDLSGMPSLSLSATDLVGTLGLVVQKNRLFFYQILLKRVLDYSLAVPLFALSLPIIGFLALWVKRVSPGPAFYSQEREGYQGKSIRVWKIRTMYLDAEERLQEFLQKNPEARNEWERFFKLKNDPRVIPGVGYFLRRTSLDELPQLWNVIKGEMSLVGPRPFPRYHLEKFSSEFRLLRRSVLPGITGLWQVAARSEGDLGVQEFLDSYYIRNWSLWLDIYILARTLWVVIAGRGAY